MRRLLVAALVVVSLGSAGAPRVAGQVAPTTTQPPGEDSGGDEGSDDGAGPELPPLDGDLLASANTEAERAAAEIRLRIRGLAEARLEIARSGDAEARSTLAAANERLVGLLAQLQAAGAELDQIQFTHREVLTKYRDAQRTLAEHVALLYTRNPDVIIANDLLKTGDLDLAVTRSHLIRAVLDSDRRQLLDSYVAAAASRPDIEERASDLQGDASGVDALAAAETLAQALLQDAEADLEDVEALATDWVFPVDGDYSFVDTFLAPRMTGTRYAHRHQGTDVFAAQGTPLVAVERGVVGRVGEVTLGGLRVWLIGESGTNYYYAHLSGFADGLEPGQFVEAGTVLGFVGNTGNAISTPPHVHFQVHPDGGAAVNPYPLLRQVADLEAG